MVESELTSNFFRRGYYQISIPLKLLLLIIPLVCIPIILVGYWSFQTSVESVTTLSKELQLFQAKNVAREIDSTFNTAFNDLEIMALFTTDLLKTSQNDELPWETDIVADKIHLLMKRYLNNSPYYLQIRFMDESAEKVLIRAPDISSLSEGDTFMTVDKANLSTFYISPIVKLPNQPIYLIHLSRPVFDRAQRLVGAIIIDLKYSMIMELVKGIRIGDKGYAFLVDEQGRTIAHPVYKPYEYDLTRYKDPRLLEFIIHILSGKTGWKGFYEQGEKVAAFAPVPTMNWSLAVGIPIDEFKKEAGILRKNTILVVLWMIFFSTILVILLSFRVIRPIRNLVMATEQVASGDLSREIPVYSNDELGMLTVSFNRMVRSLGDIQSQLVASEKLISMGRLSAGVAHEIRNPLNAMKGAVTYLRRRRSEDALVMEYAGIIFEEVERLSEFVTEFLLFARQSEPRKSALDINELIRMVVTLFQTEFQDENIDVIEQLPPSLPIAMVDSQQLEQVLFNLFINAGHAMQGGGELRISTQGPFMGTQEKNNGDEVATIRITIQDTGTGIDDKDLEFICDPFYSTKDSGTGLGLPISLSIVENHGGRLKILSIKDKGTTITIDLPVE
ncbi:MAG: cache domain-containing protein [Desulfobacterium sp.]